MIEPTDLPTAPTITACFTLGGYVNNTGVPVINPGDWFGKAWLVSTPIGNYGSYFIVEADTVSDAIDEFSDSQYGYMLHVDEADLKDYPEDEREYDGSGRVIDTSNVMVYGKEGRECPFECLYHGPGIPEGGVTPLDYEILQNLSEPTRTYVAQFGNLTKRGLTVQTLADLYEEIFKLGEDAGFERCSNFHDQEIGGNIFRFLIVTKKLWAAVSSGYTSDAMDACHELWPFLRAARYLRDTRCRIDHEKIGDHEALVFKYWIENDKFEYHALSEVGEPFQWTFARILEDKGITPKVIEIAEEPFLITINDAPTK